MKDGLFVRKGKGLVALAPKPRLAGSGADHEQPAKRRPAAKKPAASTKPASRSRTPKAEASD